MNDAGFRESLFSHICLSSHQSAHPIGSWTVYYRAIAAQGWPRMAEKYLSRVSGDPTGHDLLPSSVLMGRLMFNSSFGVVNYAVATVIYRFFRSIGPLLQGHFQVMHGFLASRGSLEHDRLAGESETWPSPPSQLWTAGSGQPFCALVLLSSLTLVPTEIEEGGQARDGSLVASALASPSCPSCSQESPRF